MVVPEGSELSFKRIDLPLPDLLGGNSPDHHFTISGAFESNLLGIPGQGIQRWLRNRGCNRLGFVLSTQRAG